MSRVNDDLLQDYLDGRLSQGRRKEFEALLERDAELAGRVEACRELGRTLRDDGPELSPGFYTRARARFEDSHSEHRPPLFRLLSWEAAGLAAAAALAGILFIPGLLQWNRGEPFTEPAQATEKRFQPAKEFAEQPAVIEEELEVAEELPTQPLGLADDAATKEQQTAGWEASAEEGLRQNGLEKTAAPKQEVPRARPSVDAILVEGAPQPAVPERPAAREKKGAHAVEPRETKKRQEAMMDAETSAAYRLPDRIQLPLEAVAPGEIIVITTEDQWLNFIEGPASITELASTAYDPAFRWVLISARPTGFDCAAIEVGTGPDAYRINLWPTQMPNWAAEYGCALKLPNDGRAIEFIPATSEGHE